MLEILVGRDVKQHHDEQHLAEEELAGSPALAMGVDQVVMLPLPATSLAKSWRQQKKATLESVMRGLSTCVDYMDTDSGHA